MALTIYIVDDEPMAVQYLKMLLEGTSQRPEVIGTAPNGVKAIEEIVRLQPDFVFADISMPVMDGLKMSEEVLKQNPAQKIFILTAYRDFDYAKKSVNIGVTDYLLKNELSETVLDNLICKHMAEIELEKRRQHTLMETNMRNFLLSDVNTDADFEFYQDKPLQRYVLFFILPRPEIILEHREDRYRERLDCYQIENSVAVQGIVCRAFAQMFADEYCGIFFAQENAGNVEVKCRKAAEDIMQKFGLEQSGYCCLISSPVSRFAGLPQTYRRFRKISGFLYSGTKAICLEREIISKEDIGERVSHDLWMNEWKSVLEKENAKETDAFLDTYFEKMHAELDVWEYTERIREICSYIRRMLQNKKINAEILRMNPSYKNVESLEKDIRDSLKRYFEELYERREKLYSRYIILAQEYIHNNFKNAISILDVAEAAGISEGHLRRCFKKELDTSVLNYLTDYRLKQAKILLKKDGESIDSVWKKTGFMSAQYFSSVFRKKEGMTPSDYMKSTDMEKAGQQNE
ncbi:MAG: response regulator [Eubacteriales bacterium]|nr:response regulator [Eubacteriales bacterium]